MSKILFLDGLNLMHRARSGFQLGDYNVVFNFYRSLKPLIDQFEPTRIYFTLEGHPKRRHELLPAYKANRVIDQTTVEGKDKYKSLEDFWRQKDVIMELMQHLPISVMRHPHFEADDLIYNVIANASTAVEFTVVSSDTDFIQLLQQFPNVRLYNPVTKAFVEAPTYDYVQWKALRGDGSDNIPQLVAGLGDKTAEDLLEDPDALAAVLKEHGDAYKRNVELVRFMKWDADEAQLMTSTTPTKDWSVVERRFNEMAFKSMLKEPYLSKFKATFDALWGYHDEKEEA